ncbi:MAG: hypothetical protein M1817_004000 [Caeruleum heppii]|nr:MAG: hypothetical protein M1817_004000 [Caeruleum heppii]
MVDSALIGKPPLNDDDLNIVKALIKISGRPGANPSRGVPLGPPRPPGAPSDTRGPGVIAGMSIAMALVIFVTVSRLMVRKFHTRMEFGWDDWMIIPAALLVLAYQAVVIAMVEQACVGKHAADCTYHGFSMFIRYGAIGQTLFFVVVSFVKISLVLFYKRLVGMTSKTWRAFNNSFLVVLVLFMLISLFMNVFQCSPQSAPFDLATFGRANSVKCLKQTQMQTAFNVIHIITDFVLLLVPVAVLWKLQMSLTQKLRLMFVFSLGAISCIASVMRMVLGRKQSRDLTYDFTEKLAWTVVDVTSGVIVASLPALHSIVKFALPGNWSRSIFSFGYLSKRFSKDGSSASSVGNQKGASSSEKPWIRRQDEVELGYYPAKEANPNDLPRGRQMPWTAATQPALAPQKQAKQPPRQYGAGLSHDPEPVPERALNNVASTEVLTRPPAVRYETTASDDSSFNFMTYPPRSQ